MTNIINFKRIRAADILSLAIDQAPNAYRALLAAIASSDIHRELESKHPESTLLDVLENYKIITSARDKEVLGYCRKHGRAFHHEAGGLIGELVNSIVDFISEIKGVPMTGGDILYNLHREWQARQWRAERVLLINLKNHAVAYA